MRLLIFLVFTCFSTNNIATATINNDDVKFFKKMSSELQKKRHHKQRRKPSVYSRYTPVDQKPFFDIPVTYNKQVKRWIKYYQTTGKRWFKNRIERSYKYLPLMKSILKKKGLPQDLAYISLIESGFSATAISSASAVGYWQFIKPTALRYGLSVNWWVDERRDFLKSTYAASKYLGDLYSLFNSWYLTASGYNMGETRLKRLIKRHGTTNFWVLSQKRDFPKETREYIPKLIAALLVAKAPGLYGFKNIRPMAPYKYEYFYVPGGTDLHQVARHLGVDRKRLTRLNPELLHGFIPKYIRNHRIRIPKGSTKKVSSYVRKFSKKL